MSSQKYKASIIFALVICLSFSTLVAGESNYFEEFEAIYYEASEGMEQLGEDATKLSEEVMTLEEVLINAEGYKNQAFEQLKAMVQLTPEAPDMDFHTKSLSLIADWYLAAELWRLGLQDLEVEKIDATGQIMDVIVSKGNEIMVQAEKMFADLEDMEEVAPEPETPLVEEPGEYDEKFRVLEWEMTRDGEWAEVNGEVQNLSNQVVSARVRAEFFDHRGEVLKQWHRTFMELEPGEVEDFHMRTTAKYDEVGGLEVYVTDLRVE